MPTSRKRQLFCAFLRILYPAPSAVLQGSAAHGAVEGLRIVAAAVKAAPEGDLRDGQGGVGQQGQALAQP